MNTLDDFQQFVATRYWRYAKTMPQWPHEYTVRRFDDPRKNQAIFEEAVAFIRTHGRTQNVPAYWQKLAVPRH